MFCSYSITSFVEQKWVFFLFELHTVALHFSGTEPFMFAMFALEMRIFCTFWPILKAAPPSIGVSRSYPVTSSCMHHWQRQMTRLQRSEITTPSLWNASVSTPSVNCNCLSESVNLLRMQPIHLFVTLYCFHSASFSSLKDKNAFPLSGPNGSKAPPRPTLSPGSFYPLIYCSLSTSLNVFSRPNSLMLFSHFQQSPVHDAQQVFVGLFLKDLPQSGVTCFSFTIAPVPCPVSA